MDEGNRGDRLADVLRRSAAKMGGRTFEGTNAHAPGEGSVAEATYKAAQAGAEGLLYRAIEAPDIDDLTDLSRYVRRSRSCTATRRPTKAAGSTLIGCAAISWTRQPTLTTPAATS